MYSPYGTPYRATSYTSPTSALSEDTTVQKVKRHPRYYLLGGDIHFLVEHYLFRVHSYFFERESAVFREKLAAPAAAGQPRKGSSDTNPFPLDDVRAEEFTKFLWVFYNPQYSLYDATLEDWSAILKLAYEWRFAEVKSLCCRELEKIPIPPVQKIKLYQSYELDRKLLIPSYAELAQREEPLTLGEGRELGLETALLIATARECARGKATPSGARSPTPAQIPVTDLESVIRKVFGLQGPPTPLLSPVEPDDQPVPPVPATTVPGASIASGAATPAATKSIKLSSTNGTKTPSSGRSSSPAPSSNNPVETSTTSSTDKIKPPPATQSLLGALGSGSSSEQTPQEQQSSTTSKADNGEKSTTTGVTDTTKTTDPNVAGTEQSTSTSDDKSKQSAGDNTNTASTGGTEEEAEQPKTGTPTAKTPWSAAASGRNNRGNNKSNNKNNRVMTAGMGVNANSTVASSETSTIVGNIGRGGVQSDSSTHVTADSKSEHTSTGHSDQRQHEEVENTGSELTRTVDVQETQVAITSPKETDDVKIFEATQSGSGVTRQDDRGDTSNQSDVRDATQEGDITDALEGEHGATESGEQKQQPEDRSTSVPDEAQLDVDPQSAKTTSLELVEPGEADVTEATEEHKEPNDGEKTRRSDSHPEVSESPMGEDKINIGPQKESPTVGPSVEQQPNSDQDEFPKVRGAGDEDSHTTELIQGDETVDVKQETASDLGQNVQEVPIVESAENAEGSILQPVEAISRQNESNVDASITESHQAGLVALREGVQTDKNIDTITDPTQASEADMYAPAFDAAPSETTLVDIDDRNQSERREGNHASGGWTGVVAAELLSDAPSKSQGDNLDDSNDATILPGGNNMPNTMQDQASMAPEPGAGHVEEVITDSKEQGVQELQRGVKQKDSDAEVGVQDVKT